MKTITTKYLKTYLTISAMVIVLFMSAAGISARHHENKDQVKVKIVKVIDGDTTIIEKTMDETNVQDFTRQFQNIKGKNVQVMITVEGTDRDKKKNKKDETNVSCMKFNFDMDSTTAHSFSRAFMFSDSAMGKNFVWNDSMMKNLPKNFNFNFNFDDEGEMNDFDINMGKGDEDGKTVIIKKDNGKTIVINGDDEDENVNISEDEKGESKTKTKTIVIHNEKGNAKKKVIVSTSVIVIDEDGSSKKTKRVEKEESSFNFYPNPSDGNFSLELDLNGKEDALVRITDTNGKEIFTEKITGEGKINKNIDLNGKKGTFIVTIKQGKKITSKKIIIE